MGHGTISLFTLLLRNLSENYVIIVSQSVMTTSSTSNEELETTFTEAGSSSRNQVVLPNAINVIASSSSSSHISNCSTSDEDDGREVTLNRLPRKNIPYAITTFTNCNDVTNISNVNHIHKKEVINKNYFYCFPASKDHVLKYCLTRCCIAGFISVMVAILIIVVFSLWLSSLRIQKQEVSSIGQKDTGDIGTRTATSDADSSISADATSSVTTTTNSYDDSRSSILNYTNWKIIPRESWGALSYKKTPEKLVGLPSYIIISETGTDFCTTQQKCIKAVRNIQTTQMHEGRDDIAYNFLIGGDGMVYEGRGWDVQGDHIEYNSVDYDSNSIDVSFIGSFDIDETTEIQLQAAIALIKYGVQNKKIKADYKLRAHKQLTLIGDNPGDNLYSEITKWKGWDSETIRNFMIMEDYF